MKEIKEYRCSCCNEVKKVKTDYVYKLWTQKVKPEESEVVAICRSCNFKINKAKLIGVKEFIEWVGLK
jgi:hypothetical protein